MDEVELARFQTRFEVLPKSAFEEGIGEVREDGVEGPTEGVFAGKKLGGSPGEALGAAGVDGGEVAAFDEARAEEIVAVAGFGDDVGIGDGGDGLDGGPADEGGAGEGWIGAFGDKERAEPAFGFHFSCCRRRSH